MTSEQTVGILPAHGTTENERCGIDIEHRDNGETWLIVYAGGRKDDPEAPFTIDAAARLSPDQRAAVIAALRGDASTDTTQDAAGANESIREAVAFLRRTHGEYRAHDVILDNAAALDAARIAAEQRAEKAELVVMAARELWEADAAEGDGRDENRIFTAWCNLILLVEHARGALADPDVPQHQLVDVIDQTRARDAATDAWYAAYGDLDAEPAPARAEGGDA